MAVTREQLIWDIFANTSRAQAGFTDVGRKAAAASDDVSALAKRLDEISKKSATARVDVNDAAAQAKLDQLDRKTERLAHRVIDVPVTIEGAARAAVEIEALDRELDGLTSKSGQAAKATSGLAGGAGLAGGGLGALIGAGVALAPVLVTVTAGLGGLALAALGAGKRSQILAQELAPLKAQFAGFQKDLQPVVLADFAQAAQLAGNVLNDLEPVTVATGKALGGLFAALDAEFRSQTWQQFFSFMAQTAGPDIQLLGKNVTDLLNALPPLIEDMQPLARGLLLVSDDAVRAARGIVSFYNAFQRDVPISNQHTLGFFQQLDKWTVSVTNHLGPWARAINNAGTSAQHALTGAGSAAGSAAKGIGKVVTPAQAAATELAAMATATTNLMTAQQKALSVQTTYGADLVTSANDAVALEKALDKSRGSIGLHTAAQRSSFAAANTYITDLGNTASAAYQSGHGVDAAISSIKKGLPILDQAKTKNQQYWQEVKTLVGWLHNLELIKAIRETVYVSGNGTFTVRPGTKLGLPGGTAGGPFAAGGRVPSGYPNDTYLARLTSGEAVVPARLTPAVAPFLKAHGVPGFAAGMVPSYSGNVAGLVPWSRGDLNATVGMIERATAAATLSAMRAAAKAASGFGTPGPGGGAPAANAALARRMMPAWGSGAEWAAWNYVAMRESGWNQFARNPSSGAYGIPQALPPGKMGPAANPPQSNPAAQISWMIGYIHSRYGDPIGAAAHERAYSWYDNGGWLYPGKTLAVNNTGQPERVSSPAADKALAAALNRLAAALENAPERTGQAVGAVLNGTARGAIYSGRYSSR